MEQVTDAPAGFSTAAKSQQQFANRPPIEEKPREQMLYGR